jgi:hypothetical protein
MLMYKVVAPWELLAVTPIEEIQDILNAYNEADGALRERLADGWMVSHEEARFEVIWNAGFDGRIIVFTMRHQTPMSKMGFFADRVWRFIQREINRRGVCTN